MHLPLLRPLRPPLPPPPSWSAAISWRPATDHAGALAAFDASERSALAAGDAATGDPRRRERSAQRGAARPDAGEREAPRSAAGTHCEARRPSRARAHPLARCAQSRAALPAAAGRRAADRCGGRRERGGGMAPPFLCAGCTGRALRGARPVRRRASARAPRPLLGAARSRERCDLSPALADRADPTRTLGSRRRVGVLSREHRDAARCAPRVRRHGARLRRSRGSPAVAQPSASPRPARRCSPRRATRSRIATLPSCATTSATRAWTRGARPLRTRCRGRSSCIRSRSKTAWC